MQQAVRYMFLVFPINVKALFADNFRFHIVFFPTSFNERPQKRARTSESQDFQHMH